MTELVLNGYTDLPPGYVAAVATFLEMRAAPAPQPVSEQPGLSLRHVRQPDLEAYRDIFRRVGSNWLWTSRLMLSAEELGAVLADPETEIYLPERYGEPVGILELDFRQPAEVELAFFGLAPEEVGTGTGRWLMERAQRLAWRQGIRRVWVHTCTLDHPAALPFYLRSGFKPYARKIETYPDPRLTGRLPPDAAPHVPIIEP